MSEVVVIEVPSRSRRAYRHYRISPRCAAGRAPVPSSGQAGLHPVLDALTVPANGAVAKPLQLSGLSRRRCGKGTRGDDPAVPIRKCCGRWASLRDGPSGAILRTLAHHAIPSTSPTAITPRQGGQSATNLPGHGARRPLDVARLGYARSTG